VPGMLDEDWLESSEQGLTVYETDNEVIVEANVAGVPEDKVDVSVEGGTVTIKAEFEETEEEKKKKKVVYRQSRQAKYLYSTSLPCPVKADKADAEVSNGILKLTLPKAEEVKPKKITVKAGKK
jgi:HSP20 family protein